MPKLLIVLMMLVFAPAAISAPAADHWSTPLSAEDQVRFDKAKALIEAEKFADALPGLKALANDLPSNADVANLLGFAYRKTGDLPQAEAAYIRALYLNPDHLGALEYQGELFLMQGKPKSAEANLARLKTLCITPCEEEAELAEAIAAWRKKNPN